MVLVNINKGRIFHGTRPTLTCFDSTLEYLIHLSKRSDRVLLGLNREFKTYLESVFHYERNWQNRSLNKTSEIEPIKLHASLM